VLREQIADARKTLDVLEDSMTALEQMPAMEQVETAAALEQAGAAPTAIEIAAEVKRQLVAAGIIPNTAPRPRRVTATERPSTALEPWMLVENTEQDMTRWIGLTIDGTAQAFRVFRKHLPDGKPGEKATWLVRNLAGEAWRLVKVERDPPFGPGRPLTLVPSGKATINGVEFTWRTAPTSRTMLGILYSEEKSLRYALIRDTSLDMAPEKLIPATIRGGV
jgi:hypothetical protein